MNNNINGEDHKQQQGSNYTLPNGYPSGGGGDTINACGNTDDQGPLEGKKAEMYMPQ